MGKQGERETRERRQVIEDKGRVTGSEGAMVEGQCKMDKRPVYRVGDKGLQYRGQRNK